jgi:hypothetical protein
VGEPLNNFTKLARRVLAATQEDLQKEQDKFDILNAARREQRRQGGDNGEETEGSKDNKSTSYAGRTAGGRG